MNKEGNALNYQSTRNVFLSKWTILLWLKSSLIVDEGNKISASIKPLSLKKEKKLHIIKEIFRKFLIKRKKIPAINI